MQNPAFCIVHDNVPKHVWVDFLCPSSYYDNLFKQKDPIMPNVLCLQTVVMPAISLKVVNSGRQ